VRDLGFDPEYADPDGGPGAATPEIEGGKSQGQCRQDHEVRHGDLGLESMTVFGFLLHDLVGAKQRLGRRVVTRGQDNEQKRDELVHFALL
jgi:hypothetical protein